MKILKNEEAAQVNIVGSGRVSKIGAMAAQLNVGEVLVVYKTDWRGKNPPYASVNRLAKKTGRKFVKGRMPDGSGWAFRRVA